MQNDSISKLPNRNIPSLFLADTVRLWAGGLAIERRIEDLLEEQRRIDREYSRRALVLESHPEVFGDDGYFEVEVREGLVQQRYAVSLDNDGLCIRRQRRDYAPLAAALEASEAGPEPQLSDEGLRDCIRDFIKPAGGPS